MNEVTGPTAPKPGRPRRWRYVLAPLLVLGLLIGGIAVGTRLADEDDGDGEVDIDACLEEARTAEDSDTCAIAERLDDVDGDAYIDCLNDLAVDPAVDVDDCNAILDR